MTVQRIEDNVRQKIFNAVLKQIQGIALSGGYNTQPYVTTDPDKALSPTLGKHVLFVHAGSEDVIESQVGPRFLMDLEITIAGYAFGGSGNIQIELNKLLQDARNAICGNVRTIAEAVPKINNFEMDGAEVDDGTILGNNTGGFAFSVRFSYWAGAQW